MFSLVKLLRVVITLTAVAVATILVLALWHRYMLAPWTRDGRVRAEVVALAPEVGGTVAQVKVTDNQFVHKGDILFVIDPERFRLAVAQAQAALDMRRQDLRVSQAKAERRAHLSEFAVSAEEREQSRGTAGSAQANVDEAQATLNLARLNLDRTVIRSPANGYVTNLRLRVGDYLSAGQAAVSVVDSDSFWMVGYFEETKLGQIHEGDQVTISLMGYDQPMIGHVDSIARGIADTNGESAGKGLSNVNPVFTWVRLAQRIPIHIRLSALPPGVILAAGMTGTVHVGEPATFSGDIRFALGLLARLWE